MKPSRTRAPTALDYMTPVPHTIGREQTIAYARDVMRSLGCRHLPVLHGGKLVGLLSERDIFLFEAFDGVQPEKVRVEDVMSPEPYVVGPHASLAEIAAVMAERKYGSAVVVDGQGQVAGVITTTDLCRALAELLAER